MNSVEIRQAFLDFFRSKEHQIVSSAPMVVKNDPTLMFTNAGMNQFKDIFLGNAPAQFKRIADTQKCLRVSGKHNDLEEVGHDTYHHTMFEMLGNWSFGDYFKERAIAWAWEFLTEVVKIDKNRMYVTVFEGSPSDLLEEDKEAATLWARHIDPSRIILGNKKDNFWEMGETGPCGPCSEIHVDIRNEEERKKTDGKSLVNAGHPQVIEIWNLVFMQYNRKANGQLEFLPAKHVDTGMGFERLCMVLQGKQSNYDTDIFQDIIKEIGALSGKKYGENEKADIAMRVIADHLRAVSFAIADGQLPSNNKAGYVIRRILRRAVRYGYTFLGLEEPFIFKLVPVLAEKMAGTFTELKSQQQLVMQVIHEEEASFLRTLATGIRLLEQISARCKTSGVFEVDGKTIFELYDTYGFPIDLTELILRENGLTPDREGFETELKAQKERSRSAASVETGDWIGLTDDETEHFVGYDTTETEISIARYRSVSSKGKTLYQLVFDQTPFYGESGGQIGDQGYFEANGEKIKIIDTIKENNLIIHVAESLPNDLSARFKAVVDTEKRASTAGNHSATHLMDFALRQVLGTHVEQKGSLVTPGYLRFDFSHFQKMSDEEIRKTETLVNRMIRENIQLEDFRNIPIEEARNAGAIALFGEKYGDHVRMVKFGPSVELCGGTHVAATGKIGSFKIISESSVAAGVRRIEAISGAAVEEYLNKKEELLAGISEALKNPQDVLRTIEHLIAEKSTLEKKLETLERNQLKGLADELMAKAEKIAGVTVIAAQVEVSSAALLKDLAYQLKESSETAVFVILGATIEGKANLAILVSEELTKEKGLHAGNIVREAAKEVQGGGGGQPVFATAGGKNPANLAQAIEKAKNAIK
jgi:alanyl-tRNA synthetase